MKKRVLIITIVSSLVFISYKFYQSPSLGGLIPGGKDMPDKTIEKLEFDLTRNQDYKIVYLNHVNEPKFQKLRLDFNLDSIINNAKTEFEKIILIQSWVNKRWKHDGGNKPEKNDAYYILNQASKGKKFRCVEYGIVTTECLKALGFKVRTVYLMTKDVDVVNSGAGHVINEVFINELNKWVFIDPQWDVTITKNNLPLNSIEFQKAIYTNENIEMINPNNLISKSEYLDWIGPYLFYFNISMNNGKIGIWDRVLGKKGQLTLVPKGEKEPKYFQRESRLNNMYFTNSTNDFYQIDN